MGKLFNLCVLVLSWHIVFAQKEEIKGLVTNEKNHPLQYVNIYLEDSDYGTITNKEGWFSLTIPHNSSQKSLVVRHIGYRTDTIRTSSNQDYYSICLKMLDYPINEISVCPDDSVARILNEAIQRIPENYISVNSRQVGFYREYLQNKAMYLYFGEAMVDFFQPSYKTKEDGTIRILKSRINKSEGLDSISQLYFYGGVTLHIRNDIIKQRSLFFNPNNFDLYIYHIDSIIKDGFQIFWKVGVSPAYRSKSKYRGHFILDSSSLAIKEAHFQYTDEGILNRTKTLNQSLECISRQILIIYGGEEGSYYLKYLRDEEKFRRKSTNVDYVQLNEYVTTSVDTIANSPIPFREQNQSSTIFSTYAKDYSKSDWKDYTVLTKDSSMNNLELMELSGNESARLLSQRYDLNLKEKLKRSLTTVAVRLFFDVSARVRQFPSGSTIGFDYLPDASHHFPIAIEGTSSEPSYTFGMLMGYRLTNCWSVFLESESQLNAHYYRSTGLGLRYQMALKNYGKKMFLTPSIKVGNDHYGLDAGIQDNPAKFSAGGKKFDSKEVSFAVGESMVSTVLGIGLRKEVSRNMSVSLSMEYAMPVSSTSKLFMKEASGFWLTRRRGMEKIAQNSHVNISEENLQAIKEISLRNFGFKLGVEFGR